MENLKYFCSKYALSGDAEQTGATLKGVWGNFIIFRQE